MKLKLIKPQNKYSRISRASMLFAIAKDAWPDLPNCLLHVAICTIYNGPPPGKYGRERGCYVVDHIDGDKQNNCPLNLRWLLTEHNVSIGNIGVKKPNNGKIKHKHTDNAKLKASISAKQRQNRPLANWRAISANFLAKQGLSTNSIMAKLDCPYSIAHKAVLANRGL